MTRPFIAIDSHAGRIGRFCWVNSDLRGDHRRGALATWRDGQQAILWDGWWGSTYFCSQHPARPGEAW